jgi:hypothetical protein
MEREEITLRLFQYFRRQLEVGNSGRTPQIQIGSGMLQDFSDVMESLAGYKRTELEMEILDIVHEFIRNGWLHPGNALVGNNSMYPWITITNVGKKVFQNEDWVPFDPDGYVAYIHKKNPDISQITLQYLGEAVAAYHRRHLLSATLTLGVASENEILDLIDAYLEWIDDSRSEKLENKINRRSISHKFEEFKKALTSDLNKLPEGIRSEWETYLDGIFQFIRLNRNAAGHPSGKQLEAKIVFANLQVFSDYVVFIHKMINFFRN